MAFPEEALAAETKFESALLMTLFSLALVPRPNFLLENLAPDLNYSAEREKLEFVPLMPLSWEKLAASSKFESVFLIIFP